MQLLPLHEFHAGLNAQFVELSGQEAVVHYGDWLAEHRALREAAGVIDLSFRGRLCLLGEDRQRFLHGQVTNDVKKLEAGQGCYAAIISGKGKMQADLNIFRLENELLLDFEPGLADELVQRLDKYIIADDVQVVDVAPHYGLLSVQGPKSAEALAKLGLPVILPDKPLDLVKLADETLGELYIANHARLGSQGFDLFVPTASLGAVLDKLIASCREVGGDAAGWRAFDTARIEAGIPRFGVDMDETNLPPEAGLEGKAVSYSKGCYIGQEVIARIRTYGQVAKALRGLRLADDLAALPVKGDKLVKDGKDVGYITSAVASPALKANIALGYVRKECNQPGTVLTLRVGAGEARAFIVPLPFGWDGAIERSPAA
jgi:folate-binding protein YgfZ